MDSSSGRQRSNTRRSPPTKSTPSPRATTPLVPLTGQSRKSSPRVRLSAASRAVSAGEIVLIWMRTWPGFPAAATPSGPRTAASTVGRVGSRMHTASLARATARAEAAASPPMPSSARTRSGAVSKPTTRCPALSNRPATAVPSSPTPTTPIVM